MNQPTREEFEDLKEDVRKLREQQTEPIQITVERRYPDRELLQEVLRKQDEQFNSLKAEIKSIVANQNEYAKGLFLHSRSIATLQDEMKAARADILKIREAQADQRDQIKEIKDDILKIRESQADQRDQIKEIKNDLSGLKNDFSSLKATQERQGLLLQEILDRLPPKQ